MHPTTPKHLRYAAGYTELDMFAEAADELAKIAFEDRQNPLVLGAQMTLHMGAKRWDDVVRAAAQLARAAPEEESAWINWAYALRELQRIEDARRVLLEAEPLHGAKSAVLHYNMACYECLLGNRDEARARLRTACHMHKPFKDEAKRDPDLQAMWETPA